MKVPRQNEGLPAELRQPSQLGGPIDRREFLSVVAASLALAGLTGCSPRPAASIVPYVRAPEDVIPGTPDYYATALTFAGSAIGVVVESHLGRPIKIEGNPDHPASLGATDALTQAAILDLYDPDRSQTVMRRGQISTWNAFTTALADVVAARTANGGRGLRLLTGCVTSPTTNAQIAALLATMPEARWHSYEPGIAKGPRLGAQLAFGRFVDTIYSFERADVILSLDADVLASPGNVRYAREYAARRKPDRPSSMNRLYAIESCPTLTGSMADHRFSMRSGEVGNLARRLHSVLANFTGDTETKTAALPWFDALIADLSAHKGRSIVIAGQAQPPEVHALVHRINQTLGNVGTTVFFIEPVEGQPRDHDESLRQLVQEMSRGEVEVLLIVGANPVYSAPGDLAFASHLAKVPVVIDCSHYYDETAELCEWHIPLAHPLESWSDARAYDGTISIVQPLIEPLYGGKTIHQILAAVAGESESLGLEIVQRYWRARVTGDFDQFWQRTLRDGVVGNSAQAPLVLQPVGIQKPTVTPDSDAAGIEVVFRPDASTYDGSFANNGWLQELPRPFTTVTWEGPALIGMATAARLALKDGDVVEVRIGEAKANFPVVAVPGHAEDAVTVPFGYGRWKAGRVGSGIGSNAYVLRSSVSGWIQRGEIRSTGRRQSLAITQGHHDMEGRDLVRTGSLEEYRQKPDFARADDHGETVSWFPAFAQEGVQWGMWIDLNSCIGCNACVVACQAENNIPVVGKREVLRGREMQWIRVDRYYEGDDASPSFYHQPVPCMHCETAPCEVVCPVGATTHSSEGLNEMTYNRCVGTRYCSNNCPYKVRRFNFFQYADFETPTLKMLHNPDVTVRSRGVMEKCTYCVQRINYARIQAEKQEREIRDGEVQTACAAACPAEAIVFGNINDAQSRVARAKASPLNYGILAELNTRPRTTYGARLQNPNPSIPANRNER